MEFRRLKCLNFVFREKKIPYKTAYINRDYWETYTIVKSFIRFYQYFRLLDDNTY